MAKKKVEDLRSFQIKFLVNDEENKIINEYAGIARQSKSEFIRTAIWNRIKKIESKYQKASPRKAIIRGIKGAINAHEKGDFLIKPNEEELKKREKDKRKRMEELEKEKQVLEKKE